MTDRMGNHEKESQSSQDSSVAAPAADTASKTEESSSRILTYGKGLDVGTANLVSAVQNDTGGITIKMERNAFIDIQQDVHSKNLLTKL